MVIAQANVAHIEVQKLISEMPEVIAAQKELKRQKRHTADMETLTKNSNQTKLMLPMRPTKQKSLTSHVKRSWKVCKKIFKNINKLFLRIYKKNLSI